jgi:hypothetical protein
MKNTDTPRTDACSTERERILANALDKAIEMGAKAEAEVERLDAERRELSRQLHLHEMGMYHEPKMQKEIDKLQSQLAQAVEIAEMFSQVKGLHHYCNCAMCQKLAALKEEIK